MSPMVTAQGHLHQWPFMVVLSGSARCVVWLGRICYMGAEIRSFAHLEYIA
jgi:hypothetical protein